MTAEAHAEHQAPAPFHMGPLPKDVGHDILGPHDVVGTTFYIACNMMLAFTMFFFVQVSVVPQQWRTSVSIAGLVTGVAWYNYTFMKSQWVESQTSPTTYRYTDWLVTVPLQIVEFYFILKAAGPVSSGVGVRLFSASLLMVLSGWLAEIDFLSKVVGFALGMFFWFYIIYEVSAGEAANIAKGLTSDGAKQAFSAIRNIVTFGWWIYPAGYAVAYFFLRGHYSGQLALNVLYNIADFVNKGLFGLAVWSAAVSEGRGAEAKLLAQ